MKYTKIVKGKFISRPNRFIAHVEINGKEEVVHVKNTGRCKELLPPGAEVYLEHFDSAKRKTAYDLIAVQKGERLINMDSQAPNKAFYEWAAAGNFIGTPNLIKAEYKWGNSRFDVYLEKDERKILVEIKGVTLENDGVVLFPDAPTERGVKHINELIAAKKQGYECYICFIIQMSNVKHISPNDATHPQFGEALRNASRAGVNILALDCRITPDSMVIGEKVPVVL